LLLREANIQIAMNFLAHLYLSNEIPELVVGNFIADAVKGSALDKYDKEVKRGIMMHRAIDTYTDNHQLVKECVQLLRPTQGKFSPVVLDILFDHFLAKEWWRYHTRSLNDFSEEMYEHLLYYQRSNGLPKPMDFVLEMMIKDNWLVNYQFGEGIERSLCGMQQRVNYTNTMSTAFEDMQPYQIQLENKFNEFFEELRGEIKKRYFS
jgi:acyl carrier protein phosphodiesterase